VARVAIELGIALDGTGIVDDRPVDQVNRIRPPGIERVEVGEPKAAIN